MSREKLQKQVNLLRAARLKETDTITAIRYGIYIEKLVNYGLRKFGVVVFT